MAVIDSYKYINIALDTFGALTTLVIIICILVSSVEKDKLTRLFLRVLLTNFCLLACDALSWMVHYSTGTAPTVIAYITNFGNFTLAYLLMATFTDYMVNFIGSKTSISKRIIHVVVLLAVIATIFTIISQFNHMYYYIDAQNIYHRQWLWPLSQIWGIIALGIDAVVIIVYSKKIGFKYTMFLLSYMIFPLIALFIHLVSYSLVFLHITTTVSIVTIYIGIQSEQARIMKEQELELTESRIAIMLSQIQPHFLYNSLVVIKQLCDIDPGEAKNAVVSFSDYLRGNLDSLSLKTLVSFDSEIEHVKNYIDLEKRRFGEKFDIEYDIKVENFMLPPLSLQPIVENGVRYGVMKKHEGGTIKIASEETPGSFIVTVIDDGVGFHHDEKIDDGKTHIGLSNVSQRLSLMCNGRLEIKSEIGKGTTIKIIIPKNKRQINS